MGPHLPSSCSDQGPSWGTLTTTTVTAPEARTQGPAAPGLGLNAELGPRHNRLSLFSPNVPGPCAAWAAGAVGPFPPLSAAVAHTCEGAGRGLWSRARKPERPDDLTRARRAAAVGPADAGSLDLQTRPGRARPRDAASAAARLKPGAPGEPRSQLSGGRRPGDNPRPSASVHPHHPGAAPAHSLRGRRAPAL